MEETPGLRAVVVASTYLTIFPTTLILAPKNAIATRLGATLALGCLQYLFHHLIVEMLPFPSQHSNATTLSWIAFASGAEAILVSRIDANDLSDGKDPPRVLLWRALCIFFNWRRVGTKWEVSNLRRRRPQTRTRFLSTMLGQMTVCYLIVDAMMAAPPPDKQLVTRQKQTMLHLGNLSAEDVFFRLVACTSYWVISSSVNRINVNLAAFLSVLMGVSTPESVPYFLGPISAMYTIRGFWGTFWHQMLRKPLTGWADIVSDKFLRLRRGTLLSRYTRNFLTFLVSGLLHHSMDVVFFMPHREMVSIRFFCLQALGIMAEDAVQALTANWPAPNPLRRAVGYVWTVFWFWWTTPLWFYPAARRDDLGILFPFSIMEAIVSIVTR